MRWMLLAVTLCGFASVWGVGPWYVLPAAFVVMFTNFATFCLLYDRPQNRARSRIAEQLRRLHPNSDMAQRISTAPVVATAEDRHLGVGPMTILNVATGIAGFGLLGVGIVLRLG